MPSDLGGMTSCEPQPTRDGQIRFSDLVDVNPPFRLPDLPPDTPVSFIPMAAVDEHGQWVSRQTRPLAAVRQGFTPFREGDVLFAKITPCTQNGKGCHAVGLASGVGFGSTEFHVLRAKHGVHPRLVYHLSHMPHVRQRAASMMGGSAGQQRVPDEFFEILRVPRAVLERQEQKALLLDALDDARLLTHQVVERVRRLKAALLQELLAHGVPGRHTRYKSVYRIGSVPVDWNVACLGKVADIQQGIAIDPSRNPRRNPVPYLRVANVQMGHLNLEEIKEIEALPDERAKYALEENDVLIVEGHANITELGRAALVTKDAVGMVFQNHLFRVRTHRQTLIPRYAEAWLNSHPGRQYFKMFGGTTSGLNTVGSGQVSRLPIALPPAGEQEQICDLISLVDGRAAAEAQKAEGLMAAKAALAQSVLIGNMSATGLLAVGSEDGGTTA